MICSRRRIIWHIRVAITSSQKNSLDSPSTLLRFCAENLRTHLSWLRPVERHAFRRKYKNWQTKVLSVIVCTQLKCRIKDKYTWQMVANFKSKAWLFNAVKSDCKKGLVKVLHCLNISKPVRNCCTMVACCYIFMHWIVFVVIKYMQIIAYSFKTLHNFMSSV